MDYSDLQEDDRVIWEDPNKDYKQIECLVVRINDYGRDVSDDTIVTIMDNEGVAYDVYACELEFK